jgi:hypothetical protein
LNKHKNQTQNKQKGNREAKISQMRYRRPDVGQGVRTDSSTETCIFSTYQGVRTLTGRPDGVVGNSTNPQEASGRNCRELLSKGKSAQSVRTWIRASGRNCRLVLDFFEIWLYFPHFLTPTLKINIVPNVISEIDNSNG